MKDEYQPIALGLVLLFILCGMSLVEVLLNGWGL